MSVMTNESSGSVQGWTFVDSVTVTSIGVNSASKTVSVPSTAKEFLVQIVSNNGVQASGVGVVGDAQINARFIAIGDNGAVSLYLVARFMGNTLSVYNSYNSAGVSQTSTAKLYYK